ncbi:hypothetical protein FDP41_008566 [Naegleria fowleri]|uniref:Uncharacterized protein n=1 Tax=Naegleria fowleri TaxID=5763 RepID=A0A6A5BKH5_NAEFO|nr:uncharacterized protein FDP41_008566 [Naegleria fowleri]KAF0973359.1 hypothetical protein FDP41_008566 [Naegleria fowleri]CAG4716551.1 unnamed protein product [Naegleria fowleri]
MQSTSLPSSQHELVRSESISSVQSSQESLLSHTTTTTATVQTPPSHQTFIPFFQNHHHQQQYLNNHSPFINTSPSNDSISITIETLEEGDQDNHSGQYGIPQTTTMSHKTSSNSQPHTRRLDKPSQPQEESGLFASFVDSLIEYFEDWLEEPVRGDKMEQVAEAKTQLNGLY